MKFVKPQGRAADRSYEDALKMLRRKQLFKSFL